MNVIAVINQKGGVGKSTTAQAISAGLYEQGYNVLTIDLDPQGNLTYSMGVLEPKYSAMDFLLGTPAGDIIISGLKGDLIPAGSNLAEADRTFTELAREYRLKEALLPLQKYDYVVIDTPPSLSILTINALTASHMAIVPAQADIYSLQGIGQLYQTIDAVKNYTNPGLKILGILLTRHNPRTILSQDLTEMIQETATRLNTKVFSTPIREAVAIKEAQASQTDIFSYSPRSNPAQDYRELINEIIREVNHE